MDITQERDRAHGLTDAEEPEEALAGPDLISAAAKGASKLSDEDKQNALDWFLSADEGDFTKTISLNVGGPVDEDGTALEPSNPPVWIDWTVRPLDMDTIKRVRRQASGANRRGRRQAAQTGEFDDLMFNLGVVVEATVNPDLVQAAQTLNVADPRQAVKMRFAKKSGLIGQIVGEVLGLSGYDENDVRDASEVVVAAGESSE